MSFQPSKTFINLPVSDLDQAVAFFTKLGFAFNPQFTDENATSMIINDSTFAMLLVKPHFQTFTPKEIVDAKQSTEVLIAFLVESREKVDEIINAAVNAGGSSIGSSKDYGFMYSWSFQDLDGHIWEVFYMDEQAAQ